ncbi:MAG: HAD family phosphatase [Clostridiales bacterium]|nr:HAD family phosphatase [Clostridiales bacterium]
MRDLKNIMLLSDMDGTLLNSKSEVSEKNKQAIRDFVARGGRFGIATGRSHLNSKKFTDEVDINTPCIMYNGCGLFDYSSNEFLKIYELPKAKLKKFLNDCLKNYRNVNIQIYSPYMCHIVSEEALANKELTSIHQPCEFCRVEDIEEKPWIKILLFGETEDLNSIENTVREFGLEGEIDTVYSSKNFLELLPFGVSKGSMLLDLKEILEESYKVYAVGDYNNDKEMLINADVGIAIGNAIQALKEIADYVTVSNDEDAIAEVIYNIILKGE